MENKFFGCIGLTVAMVVLVLVSCAVSGFVGSVLWNWFAVPLLGAPSMSIPGAIGLALVVSAFVPRSSSNDNDKNKSWEHITARVIAAVMTPLFALLIGWIVKGWI